MGKAEPGSAKAIAKKIKAKGLKKIKFYCEMCQKQCGDANAFKNHKQTEGHMRQMSLFASGAGEFIDKFSNEFMETFLEVLRRRYRAQFVDINQAYQEIVAQRDHVHMTATRWETLGEFAQYLGEVGLAHVDYNGERGTYNVKLIDRDLEAEREAAKKAEADMNDAAAASAFLKAQLAAAAKDTARAAAAGATIDHSLHKEAKDTPVTFALASGSSLVKAPAAPIPVSHSDSSGAISAAATTLSMGTGSKAPSSSNPPVGAKRQLSALESLKAEQESRAAKKAAADAAATASAASVGASTSTSASASTSAGTSARSGPGGKWLHVGIVVKILNQTLMDGALYKKKAAVKAVQEDGRIGKLAVLPEGKPKLMLDTTQVETVIPKPGGKVRVVAGPHAPSSGTLVSVDLDAGTGSIELKSGRTVAGVPFEHFSKRL